MNRGFGCSFILGVGSSPRQHAGWVGRREQDGSGFPCPRSQGHVAELCGAPFVPLHITISCLHASPSHASTCHSLMPRRVSRIPPHDTLSCLHVALSHAFASLSHGSTHHLQWDHGTRNEGKAQYDALVNIIASTDSDGLNGDTMDGVNASFYNEGLRCVAQHCAGRGVRARLSPNCVRGLCCPSYRRHARTLHCDEDPRDAADSALALVVRGHAPPAHAWVDSCAQGRAVTR